MGSNWPIESDTPDRRMPHGSTCDECGSALGPRAKQCWHCGRLLDDPENMRENELMSDGRDGHRERSIDVFRAALREAQQDQGLMLDGRRWCDSPRREDDPGDDGSNDQGR